MNKTKSMVLALALGALALQSCKDDEFQINPPSLEIAEYTGTGELQFLYSTDKGKTFSAVMPSGLTSGQTVLVKINNGKEDLLNEDYSFDWTGSTPAPTTTDSYVAEFRVPDGNLSPKVKVEELWSIVTSHRKSGKFYTLNPATGAATEEFTATFDGAALNEVRGFVYHLKERKFYASVSSYIQNEQAGFLYSINPVTDEATRINENNGENDHDVWDALVNLAVAADDSLVAVGDFNDEGNGIVKFGTNGKRAEKTAVVDFCCGLGMTWGDNQSEILVANGWSTDNGEVILETYALNGELQDEQLINTFEGFPGVLDLSTVWLPMKSLAKDKNGVLYGLLFDEDNGVTYFVKVDRANEKVVYISTLGDGPTNQYNTLAYVPRHTL
jgi:hypothetical protein